MKKLEKIVSDSRCKMKKHRSFFWLTKIKLNTTNNCLVEIYWLETILWDGDTIRTIQR
jgi:hypothetical protein